MSVSAAQSTVIIFFYCFIFAFGSFSNGLVVSAYLRWRRTMITAPRDVLILSLAVGDFVSAFLACPLAFTSAISRRWLWGDVGCIWYAFITTWVGLSSIIQLAFLAVERYITLKSPTLNLVTVWQCSKAIMASWSLTLVVSFLPVIGWSQYTFEGLKLHCAIHWDTRSISNLTYCLFLLIIFYLAPVGAIVFSYLKILFIVRAMYKNANRMWGPEAQATKESYVAQVKTAKQLFFMIIGFMLAWTPYAIMSMMTLFFDRTIPLSHREYPAIFAKTAVIYNPIIYFFTYRKMRRKVSEMLKCRGHAIFPSSLVVLNN